MFKIIKSGFSSFVDNISKENPLTNIYAFGRSLIALSTFFTLLFNNPYSIFKPIAGIEEVPLCVNEASSSFFCVFRDFIPLQFTVIIALIILFLVIIGLYPRYTCLLHYWITVSFSGSATILDGGDQVNTVISFLLIPICLMDGRKWAYNSDHKNSNNQIINIFLWVTFGVIVLQVGIIYLNASIEKLKVEEWRNGTAVYYFFSSSILGMPNYLKPLMNPILTNPFFVTVITYGTLFLEFMLFCSIFMQRNLKLILFLIGVSFHFLIVIIHGLPTFFLSMSGALVFLLLPKNDFLQNIYKFYKNE